MASKTEIDHDVRGHAYFNTIKEVYDWQEGSVDPLQKSNTPLLMRPLPEAPASSPTEKSSNVLLLPDSANGYHPNGYDGCQGAIVDSEVFILEQWQRVKVLSYFTHARVGIPPPTWVNAGHRNGALVLGTFCIEAEEGEAHKETVEFFQQQDGKYKLASILARMAACYGFDGWFVNIESRFYATRREWDGGKSLEALLDQLKRELKSLPSGGKVVWYDAVTKDNSVEYQNSLNDANGGFAAAAGSIMTNYWWNLEQHVDPAVQYAKDSQMSLSNVFFGIECWAQTGGNKTYGTDSADENTLGAPGRGVGHGGTATGLAVKPLSQRGLGTAIFSAHWAYGHFYRDGHKGEGDMYSRTVDRFMWEGKPSLEELPDLKCECNTNLGIKTHLRQDFRNNPIKNFAKQYPAGSEGFFHTDYKEPVSYLGPQKFRAHIGQQSILPPPGERSATLKSKTDGKDVGSLSAQLKDVFLQSDNSPIIEGPPRCSVGLIITDTSSNGEVSPEGKLILHRTNVRGNLDVDLIIRYRNSSRSPGLKIGFFAIYGENLKIGDLPAEPQTHDIQVLQIRNTQDRITAIGISVECPAEAITSIPSGDTLPLLEIFQMTLKPTKENYPTKESHDARESGPPSEINDIRFVQRGRGETAHHRLTWSISKIPPSSTYLPWSPLTGPFSYFSICADGEWSPSRAYATEFIIDELAYRGWRNSGRKQVKFEVRGYTFDGTLMATKSEDLYFPV